MAATMHTGFTSFTGFAGFARFTSLTGSTYVSIAGKTGIGTGSTVMMIIVGDGSRDGFSRGRLARFAIASSTLTRISACT